MTAAVHTDSRPLFLVDAAATQELGARLGTGLRGGDLVCLSGPLGAGKTTLARGAIAAWTGEAQDAPSPTYTLMQGYDGPRGTLWHVDLYRLKSPEEAQELGLDDAMAGGACLIEWPERLGAALPADRLEIELASEDGGRRADMRAYGTWRARLDAI